MTQSRVQCPECRATLRVAQALPAKAICPRCKWRFVAEQEAVEPTPSLSPAQATPAASALPVPLDALSPLPLDNDEIAVRPVRPAVALTIGGVVLLLLGGVAATLYFLLGSGKEVADAATAPATSAGRPAQRPHEDPDDFGTGTEVSANVYRGNPGDTLTAEERRSIDLAVQRGVKFLRSHLPTLLKTKPASGHYSHIGETALIGYTLLECGVAATDPDIRRIAERIRSAGASLTNTYAISASVLFLDRLGDPDDHALIRSLALRLMAGQTRRGGWDYDCPVLPLKDEGPFLEALVHLTSPEKLSKAYKQGQASTVVEPQDRERLAALPARLQSLPVLQYHPSKRVKGERVQGHEDNSNTQFALLALWTAQRQGVPVDRSLALVDDRFRSSQNADGSWGYEFGSRTRPQSMTCAGLLGLAAAKGKNLAALYDAKGDIPRHADPAIEQGLRFLNICLQKHMASGEAKLTIRREDAISQFYFLWSVERVGMLYDLPRMGGGDWYAWGCRVILARQQDKGGWRDNWLGPDTCFALLFLKRVNAVSDLTEKLIEFGLPATLRKD